MSEATQEKQERGRTRIQPFTVEFRDDKNRTIVCNTFKEKYRGGWSNSNSPNSAGGKMASMPNIPGLRMTVNVAERTVKVSDPLEKENRTLAGVNATLKKGTVMSGEGVTYVESVTKKNVNDDTMKTLLLELADKLEEGKVEVFSGKMPDRNAINSLPGHKLHDPLSSSAFKPRYEKDYDDYARKVDARY